MTRTAPDFSTADPVSLLGHHVRVRLPGRVPGAGADAGKAAHEHVWVRVTTLTADGRLLGRIALPPLLDLDCGARLDGEVVVDQTAVGAIWIGDVEWPGEEEQP